MPTAGAAQPSGANRQAAIDEATEPDDGFLGLPVAMGDVLPIEPIQFSQNNSPSMNLADLAKS